VNPLAFVGLHSSVDARSHFPQQTWALALHRGTMKQALAAIARERYHNAAKSIIRKYEKLNEKRHQPDLAAHSRHDAQMIQPFRLICFLSGSAHSCPQFTVLTRAPPPILQKVSSTRAESGPIIRSSLNRLLRMCCSLRSKRFSHIRRVPSQGAGQIHR
jgi:hypothetical protein